MFVLFENENVIVNFYIPDEPLYVPLLDPCEPAFGRTHDFVLHKFGQQIPPVDEHSESCKHFGVHDDVCDDSGHSPNAIVEEEEEKKVVCQLT